MGPTEVRRWGGREEVGGGRVTLGSGERKEGVRILGPWQRREEGLSWKPDLKIMSACSPSTPKFVSCLMVVNL